MSKYQFFMGKLVIMLSSIIIGIPVGIFFAFLYFIRVAISFPLQMYAVALDKWEKKLQVEEADVWSRHIARMQEKQNQN